MHRAARERSGELLPGGANTAAAIAAAAAVVAPALIAFNVPPSATFLNQVAALIGWAGWLMLLAASLPRGGRRPAPTPARWRWSPRSLLLALAALVAPLWTGLPSTLSLSAVGTDRRRGADGRDRASACSAPASVSRPSRRSASRCWSPGWPAPRSAWCRCSPPSWPTATGSRVSTLGDRAVGNLRQPNHLCSLLLWSMIAAVWLAQTRRLPRALAPAVLLLLLAGVVLSASRTGMIGVALLALWGLVDRRLSAARAFAVAGAGGLRAAVRADHRLGRTSTTRCSAAKRSCTKSDISSSRFGIWANTLALIAAHPWVGVGFGEFNFAWSLTPFPGRPVAFFDHTHNLPLQLAVELGLPLAALVLALLLWALWRGLVAGARRGEADDRVDCAAPRCVMVLMIVAAQPARVPAVVRLLPAADGVRLRAVPRRARRPPRAGAGGRASRVDALVLVGALVLMVGGAASLLDYRRVVVIFAPPDNAAPLAQRIADGRRSWFFGHHADYAAATTRRAPVAARWRPSSARRTTCWTRA